MSSGGSAEPMDVPVSGQIGGGGGATAPGGPSYSGDTGTTGFEDEPPLLQGRAFIPPVFYLLCCPSM